MSTLFFVISIRCPSVCFWAAFTLFLAFIQNHWRHLKYKYILLHSSLQTYPMPWKQDLAGFFHVHVHTVYLTNVVAKAQMWSEVHGKWWISFIEKTCSDPDKCLVLRGTQKCGFTSQWSCRSRNIPCFIVVPSTQQTVHCQSSFPLRWNSEFPDAEHISGKWTQGHPAKKVGSHRYLKQDQHSPFHPVLDVLSSVHRSSYPLTFTPNLNWSYVWWPRELNATTANDNNKMHKHCALLE